MNPFGFCDPSQSEFYTLGRPKTARQLQQRVSVGISANSETMLALFGITVKPKSKLNDIEPRVKTPGCLFLRRNHYPQK
jgi:hypothetical protein